ncbi:hypothetical protein N878_05020 [Pseudomonas sp. EGD-AK9]|nr:hypothetical protein N878_05020 [Pseudomonas sp. EGD-AK9]
MQQAGDENECKNTGYAQGLVPGGGNVLRLPQWLVVLLRRGG